MLRRLRGWRKSWKPISQIHPAAALLEDGRVAFDMRSSRYSISESRGRCLLQLWNEERNLVRAVVDVKERAHCLRIVTRRMGAARPQTLELAPTGDRRTPTLRETARRNYQRLLERVLTRHFPGAKVDGLRSAMDLEHSFGPAYVRGRLLRGTAADAVIGVSEAESASSIDGIVTLGILWLDFCRQRGDGRRHFGGLKVIAPLGASRTVAERMAWLNHAAANFELYELDEHSEELAPVDFRDTGRRQTAKMRYPHSSARDTSKEWRFLRWRRECCWPRRPCAFIPPMRRCCVIFRRKWNGIWSLSASTGGAS